MSSLPPVIAWDYQFAPNSQKSRNYLYATNTPFKICEQPFFIPRPILRAIGITYRRVPVLSIGKDVFPDNASFIDAMQTLLEKQGKGLARRIDDRAYEAWGYRSFWIALPCVPVDFNSKQLQNDRKDLFPLFGRPDYARLQVNAASELRSLMVTVEEEFLKEGGPWIAGNECSLADIHAMWMIKWALKTMGMEKHPGLERDDFPKVYKWVEGIPNHDEEIEKNDKISEEQARESIFGSEYALPDIGIDAKDPLQYQADEEVYVEPTDAEPGQHPQNGKLRGLSHNKIVIELENGLRMHFPRVGYVCHRAKDAEGRSVLDTLKKAVGLPIEEAGTGDFLRNCKSQYEHNTQQARSPSQEKVPTATINSHLHRQSKEMLSVLTFCYYFSLTLIRVLVDERALLSYYDLALNVVDLVVTVHRTTHEREDVEEG